MNAKEMEATIVALRARIDELERSTTRGALDELAAQLRTVDEAGASRVEELRAMIEEHRTSHDALKTKVDEMSAALADIMPKVLARNASAAVKRNMVDADALRVIVGDLKNMPHKEAAEAAGITYAQVYSCRLEYTFKHIHKQLRDSGQTNPWAKDAKK